MENVLISASEEGVTNCIIFWKNTGVVFGSDLYKWNVLFKLYLIGFKLATHYPSVKPHFTV